ncbi:MAG: hypothetical protein AAB515_03835 [Patescibacteria group bacterium]
MHFFTKLFKDHQHSGTNVAYVRLWHMVASVEQAVQPTLRSAPFIVTDARHTPLRIVDANELARTLGIKPGMDVQHVRRRFPHVQVRGLNVERLQGFISAFHCIAKKWGRVTSTTQDGQGLTVLIPAVDALQRAAVFLHIQEACWKELECNVAVGVGPSVDFAHLAAMACPEPGFRYLDRQEQQSLNTLPVSIIPGIGKRTARALVELDVATVWHFMQLDLTTIGELGGRSLVRIANRYIPAASLPLTPQYQVPGQLVGLNVFAANHNL